MGTSSSQAMAAYGRASIMSNDEAMTYLPMVKHIAYHIKARLPASVEVDDLIQAGAIGLINASKHYDASQGASFETYAGIRIRGQIMDELRSQQWVSRGQCKQARELEEARMALEQQLGHQASDNEMARHMKLSIDDYQQTVLNAHMGPVLSFNDGEVDAEVALSESRAETFRPDDELDTLRRTQAVVDAIERLKATDRECINLYYSEELNLREIASIYGISESAACLRLKNAILRLKHNLREWRDNDET